MEKSSTSPATNNAIRGAEQSGNKPSNGLLGRVKKVRGSHGKLGGLKNK